jgi:hypothetical protein
MTKQLRAGVQLAAAVVDDDFTFSIFGACTMP